MERQMARERFNDLDARLRLQVSAAQCMEDAEAFTLLMHAHLYLSDRRAYAATRLGSLV